MRRRQNAKTINGTNDFLSTTRQIVKAESPVPTVDLHALVAGLNFGRTSKSRIFWMCKRLFDLVLAVCLMVVLFPVLIFFATAIVIESPGSPIFFQRRIGESLRVFRIYKFRTMYLEVPDLPVMIMDEESGTLRRPTMKEDKRVTRVGRFLRRWSIDELPQIFNILLGDMSFVGPRPLTETESKQVPLAGLIRYSVPSGLTGLGQIRNRSIIHTPQRFDSDREYVENLGFSMELYIVLRTFGAIVRGQD